MVTAKQRKLAKAIIENSTREEPLNAGQMLESVGYSKSMSTAKPGEMIESAGVQKALEEYGFTEENAKTVVSNILLSEKSRDENKLRAAEQIFKVKGSYAAEKHVNINVNVNPETKAKANDALGQALIG